MNSEEIVQHLLEFVGNTGKIPELDEPGLENLIKEAIRTFGSLENALRVAGLISEGAQPLPQPRRKRRFSKTQKQTARPSNRFRSYPKEYFLDLLKLKRVGSQYPAPEGAPKWWERKAGKKYICSSCKKPIEKTERYIARKTLTPGRKGIYGYRGTYHTHYYHIICLLKEKKDSVVERVGNLVLGIQSLEREIADLRNEISVKTEKIETHKRTIDQKKEDYRASSRSAKIRKWLGCKYKIWSLNRAIMQLQERIDQIENQEIPNRQRNIGEESTRKSDLEHYMGTIEADIKKLE